MDSGTVNRLHAATAMWHHRAAALLLSLPGVGLALAVIWFVPQNTAALVALLVFAFALIVGMCVPALQCLTLWPRIMLILIALRPLMDVVQPYPLSSSTFSLQNLYAVSILALLVISWRKSSHPYGLLAGPNRYILALLGMSLLACAVGELGSGANGFARTAWGLLVALLLGPLFRTERQIDLFVRTIFYSSVLVLLVLAFHLREGQYLYDLWRLGGQYRIPNTLAGVAFSLFAYGLYVLELDGTGIGKLLDLSLLGLLAAVIVLTQSQTVGVLIIVSVCLWLWVHKRMWALYLTAASSTALVTWFGTSFEWRLLANLSLRAGEIDPRVLTTGRTYQWAQTLQQYADASFFHKLVGLGWGKVFANFESFGFEMSSVTENSFLWFLVGTGIIGLMAFSAYLVWLLRRTWAGFRHPLSEFERRLALLGFIAGLTFLIEGFTTDLALSPVVNCYLYAIASIFVFRSVANSGGRDEVGTSGD